MIDPVMFTIRIFGWEQPVYWYGLIVVSGILIGSFFVERELKRRGEDSEKLWDALVWVVLIGILGARLWYVLNATLGGNSLYADNPSQILNIRGGGLHIFGGFLFGAIVLLFFIRRNNLDPWLYLDSAGPGLLIGQAIGRLGNFINQELYGPPTSLPWGIPIQPTDRLAAYSDLSLYPFETTRFHPTFAYEMLWNFTAAGLLLWLSRKFEKDLKPGALFAGWLILAGVGRTFIELFRPDQPKIGDTGISYSMVVSALMAIAGAIILLARYKAINLKIAEGWSESYQVSVSGALAMPSAQAVPDKASNTKRFVAPKAKKITPRKKVGAKTPLRKGTKKTSPAKKSTK